jgi:hypothetical protein
MAFFGKVTLKPVAPGPGFIDKDQRLGLGLHLSYELIKIGLPGANGAEVDHFSLVTLGAIRDSDGVFVAIETNIECARLGHG